MRSAGPAPPRCPACGGDLAPWAGAGAPAAGFDPFFQISPGGRLFRQLACATCGLLATDPTPTPEELAAVYAGPYDFEWFRRRRFLKSLQARHRWWRLRHWRAARPSAGAAAPRLLDVGAGQGDFVRCALRSGWDALGLDPSAPEGEAGAVRRGGAEDLAGLAGNFDLITFWHCLEHLPRPRAVLAEAAARLAPGGSLVVAVPNRDARGLARSGRYWGWLQQPYVHLWHFTPAALSLLLPPGLTVRHLATREAWDQQTWFASRIYGRLTNRLPAESVLPREVLHLAGFSVAELARLLDPAAAARHMDAPELFLVAGRS